ncbi:MAG TPA: potassium channel family protein [Candidatus Competibacteraceae bacterium]|nr:potassium channel family protein [Candidatus Competibacteraceae bacterium]
MPITDTPTRQALTQARLELLKQLDHGLEMPMVVLGFVWLVLLIVELIWGLDPFLDKAGLVIWVIFLIDFAIKLTLAPRKGVYLKQNWLTVIALLVPALRVFRLVRALRLLRLAKGVRGVRLLRILTALNRGMKALGASLGRRGVGYLVALTGLVVFAGAAGMYAFERAVPDGLTSYSEALWWTAMLLTTMGSQYWPQTAEGQILCLLLALYGFTILGYLTAALAAFFIGRDATREAADAVDAQTLHALRQEIHALRAELHALNGARNTRREKVQ